MKRGARAHCPAPGATLPVAARQSPLALVLLLLAAALERSRRYRLSAGGLDQHLATLFGLTGTVRQRLPGAHALQAQPADGHLEALLHARVVVGEVAGEAAVLELDAVRVLEVDRLGPVVVDHLGDVHALGDQFLALVQERRLGAGLEGEVIEGARHAEAAGDAGVVLRGNARHPARLHEGDELIAAGVEEDVTQAAALADPDRIATHRREAEDALVELPRLVEIERGETDVGEALVGHVCVLLSCLIPQRLLVGKSSNGSSRSTRTSPGNPSTRSAMMLRRISSVPAA